MKYTLWYSCYIDLFTKRGVGSTFIEKEGMLTITFIYKEDATINELNLLAIKQGLSQIPEGSKVHICGISKYADQALMKLSSWISKDEIDLKSHSHILKHIWTMINAQDVISSEYHASRRSDPMLWVTSQACGDHFREVQIIAAQNLKFPDSMESWSYGIEFHKEEFMNINFKRPFTEHQMESLISKRRLEIDKQKEQSSWANVIQLNANKTVRSGL